MNGFRASILVAGLLSCCLAGGQNSPAPRAAADAYPASKVQPLYSLGAKQLSKTEIRNSFATPLAGRYIVVEIGFYPADGKTISLQRADFALRSSDGNDSVSPASPEVIAAVCQKRPPSSHDVALYPAANIGYVSYPVYNGNGKVQRVGGPVYGVGMGVGVGTTTSSATTDSDRKTMETELLDKELKDGEVSKPVAGYLYFPIATKEKVKYQLEYRGPDAMASLPLN